ncbi:type II toxin-antitoxin system RelE/ParE family toxin [Algoriphagus aquimarinus]|uniref:type II toxin-antitoxin system RelE/ParE family toxin n=1 Tax=Algoriphagus aquimarinus TaxID=237018 RepID=UPI0030D8E42D
METIRKIIFYKDHFETFFETLNDKAKDKVDEVLYMISILERIPTKFFKNIKGIKDLYEIRIEYESNIYRIFCCFDKGSLVVLFNGFHKKSQKTPKKELRRAELIMIEYFENKI